MDGVTDRFLTPFSPGLLPGASACDAGPTLEGLSAGLGRSAERDLTLVAGPCSGEDVTAISIIVEGDDGTDGSVLRIRLESPMPVFRVVVPLDPLDLDQPGFTVETFDEARFAVALENTGDEYQVLTKIVAIPEGANVLSDNQAFDFDVLIENPADHACPRGGSEPWRGVFEQ